MRICSPTCLLSIALILLKLGIFSTLAAQQSTSPSVSIISESPFTGKIIRNKVRLRLQPSLEGTIIRELNKGELLLIVGEEDEFYSVRPPQDIKAYVFRTYVLDNNVEGKHVNVRLSPDLEAPVIAQLNHGEHIEGVISPLNSKWLEIHPPQSAKFYVCKEFVEKIGPAAKLAEMQKRNIDVQNLLESAEEISRSELQKPYAEIHIDLPVENLNRIVQHYSDFPDQVAKAKELLNFIRDSYLQKKLAFLEAKAQASNLATPNLPIQNLSIVHIPDHEPNPEPIDGKVAAWIPIEKGYYDTWAKNQGGSMKDFYLHQRNEAVVMSGIVEPYIRHIRNKPGDYILIAKNTRLPSAYLYSTKVDLSSKIGQEVTIVAAPRPNNNFAHPAYFVLSLE